jgi:hypothetical protein
LLLDLGFELGISSREAQNPNPNFKARIKFKIPKCTLLGLCSWGLLLAFVFGLGNSLLAFVAFLSLFSLF